jgi:zinc protease
VRFELPNGLRVWVQEDHARPVVLVQTTYKVGSINDGPGTTGMAHYVEHMAYRATQNIRNEDIYGFVDRVGGRYTGGTAQMATTYTETVPSWGLEEALRTNAERMGRALFDVAEFERERTNVITEANGYVLTSAAQILRAEVMSASFELHPYRYSSATWAQDNLVLTRDQAYDFYKSYYGPNNVVLAVVGDVNPEDVRRLVEKHFASLARAPLSGAVTVVEPPQRVEKRVTLVYPDSEKHLDIVYRAPQADHPDYPALAVLDRVLAVRLNRAVAVGSGVNALTTAHGMTPYPHVYRIAASASASTDLERVVAAIQKEIDRVEAEGVSTQELEVARADAQRGPGGRGGRGGAQQVQGAGAPPRQSSLTQIATQLTSREVFSWDVSADTRDRIRAQEANVTSADLQAYVRHWLRPWMRTVGAHTPGASNFVPAWSSGREVTGDRLAIPPLTVPPAKRLRPEPVPARALEPLARIGIEAGRRVLANGVVVRAARSEGTTAAMQIRINVGVASDPHRNELALLASRLLSGDPGLQAFMPRASTTSIANDGYFDILLDFPASSTSAAVEAAVAALRNTSPTPEGIERAKRPATGAGGAGGRGAGRGFAVTVDARTRVLGAVAPLWIAADGAAASLPSIRDTDLHTFLTQRLTGDALTVSLVGPGDPAPLVDVASKAFLALEKGRHAADDSRRGGSGAGAATPVEERIPLAGEPQVTVLAGLPGVPRDHPDRRALDLLNYIVGVPSYGGRLGWALTKTGLTYSSSATTTFGAITGHILFRTECDTKNLESTIQAIREVIAGVGERGVDDWELREAQSFTLGRTLLYGPREDSGEDAIARALLDSEYSGEDFRDLPAFSRATLAVTIQQINAVARRYYRPELLKVVAIGAVPNTAQKHIFPAGTFRALFDP